MNSQSWRTQQARRLAETLLLPTNDAACTACIDQLDDYVQAQLAGQDYAAAFPVVAQHLDACVACAEAYAMLYESYANAAQMAPPAIPAVDLGFLPKQVSLAELIRAALQHTAERLRVTLSAELLAGLQAQPKPQLAMRGGEQALFDLALVEPTPLMSALHVQALAAATPETCTLRVQVSLYDRDWPDLADIPVTIHLPGGAQSSRTDAWGEAVFPNLPADQLAQLSVDVSAPPTST